MKITKNMFGKCVYCNVEYTFRLLFNTILELFSPETHWCLKLCLVHECVTNLMWILVIPVFFCGGLKEIVWLLQDGLVETLRRTRLKFVHCFLPHHNAALGECARSGTLKSNSNLTGSNMPDDLLINVPLVRSQVSVWVRFI